MRLPMDRKLIPRTTFNIFQSEQVTTVAPGYHHIVIEIAVVQDVCQLSSSAPQDDVRDAIPHFSVVEMVVARNDQGNPCLDEELMKMVPGSFVQIEAVQADNRERRFMQKNKFVLK